MKDHNTGLYSHKAKMPQKENYKKFNPNHIKLQQHLSLDFVTKEASMHRGKPQAVPYLISGVGMWQGSDHPRLMVSLRLSSFFKL